uniref:Flagellar protein FliT n=2 Tax=Bursaphelenchus xylophilus TaxID=6326 RepID=A0A1I7S3W7_BURXY
MRLKDVEQQLSTIHLDVLCSADLSVEALQDRKQVEIVDLVLKLNEKLGVLDENNDTEKRLRLQTQLNNVMNAVDEDLKQVLLSNVNIKAFRSI